MRMPSNQHRDRSSRESLDDLPDAKVVAECKKGKERAFEILYTRYSGKVYAIAYSITKNREEALDVVQDAFTKVFKHLGRFKGDSSFYTWLYRITMNLCIDITRKRKRGRTAEYIDGRQEVKDSDLVMENPGESYSRKELMDHLKSAIEQLPDYHKQVIIMREIGGMSYEEIAKATKVSRGTVMSRLFHARRKVREKMEGYLKEAE